MIILEFSLLLLIGFKSAICFNEREASYKWSPTYFNRPVAQALRSNHDYTPRYSYYGGNSRNFAQMRALPAMTTGIRRVKGSFASWTPQWNRMSSLGNKRIVWKKSMCSKIGETCLLTSLVSKVGSPCCPGSTCSPVEEGKFACIENPGSLGFYEYKGPQYDNEELDNLYDYTDK